MIRALARLSLLLAVALQALPALAQESGEPATPAEVSAKRIGFYFGLSLTKLSFDEPADGIADTADAPPQPGLPFNVTGPLVDVDFRSRLNMELFVGFRLRNKGSIEARFMQWDEKQDLFQEAEAGKAFVNVLASPLAGVSEDLDGDGDVQGIEAGSASEAGEVVDGVLDGAEDLNFTGEPLPGEPPEFIKFATSTRIVGEASTDYQVFDVDYKRQWLRKKRFELDWRVGLRVASLDQTYDVAYQQPGSFAVFTDEELDLPIAAQVGCPLGRFGSTRNARQDGDGDGREAIPGGSNAEPDGDGFLDGSCNGRIEDRITAVETLSEDRIVAQIDTQGYGLKVGLDARINLSKKWRLVGSAAVSGLHTTAEHRYRETFTSERDRYLNFIEWDFNGDGVYDIFDLDFDGSCAGLRPADCTITEADQTAIAMVQPIQFRDGIGSSVVPNPTGLPPGGYRTSNIGIMRAGDPVGESERNRDILRETRLLVDSQGKASGIKPALDLHLGLEWQFSSFAHLGFGLRSSTWFDAGKFRSVADDVAAGRDAAADGDFSLTGGFVTLTIVPR